MALTTVPASLSATALTLTTAAQPNITSVGTLTGLTVSGNIAGTLTTAAQTNITSLGTLTGLTVDGRFFVGDGSPQWPTGTIGNSAGRHMFHYNGETALLVWDESTGAQGNTGQLFLGGKPVGSSNYFSGGAIYGNVENGSNAAGELKFLTTNTSGGVATALTLDSSQNANFAGTAVGINTTRPTTNSHTQLFMGTEAVILGSSGGALDIGQNLYYNSGWKHRTTGPAAILDFSAAGEFVFYNIPSASANAAATFNESMRIDSSGNILLSSTLVSSNTSDGSDNKSIMINGGGAASDTRGGYVIVHGNEHSSNPGITRIHAGNVGTAEIQFYTAGSQKVRIKSGGDVKINSGNLGIGMDAVQALDIDRTSGLSMRFYNSGTFKAGLQVANSSGQMIATSAANDFAIRSQSNLLFASGGNTEAMRITGSGQVGINSAGTAATLQVAAKSGTTSMLVTGAASNNVATFARSTGQTLAVKELGSTSLELESSNSLGYDVGSGYNHEFRVAGAQKVRFDTNGNVSVGSHGNTPTLTHKTNTSITAAQAAAGTWSATSGEAGTYDNRGAIEVAGIYNRHFYKWAFTGNISAQTWYPFAKRSELATATNQTGSGSEDGFAMYFRIYTYLSTVGVGEYGANRLSNMIWIHNFGSNSNQIHYFNMGPALGHAPNLGDSGYGNAGPFRLRLQHRYGSDSNFAADQTFEIYSNSALTGLNPGVAGRQILIYGYLL